MILYSRTVTITLGLTLAGAVAGAASGFLAIEVAVLIYLRSFAPLPIAGDSSAIGVVFGGIVAPVLAWSVLRRVPLGRAIAGIAVGSGIGGAVGILVGAPSVNPYVPFAINMAPIPHGLAGALLGAALAAGYLNLRGGRTGRSAHTETISQ